MNTKISWKKLAFFVIAVVITATGEALNYKANIGVSPYEAVSLMLNYITLVKIGTISLTLNLLMIVLQIIFDRKITLAYVLQIPLAVIMGSIINLIVYTFLGNVELAYPDRFILMVVGLTISAIGVGFLMILNVVVFPLEGFCRVITNTFHWKFEIFRQAVDIFFIILCLVVGYFSQCGYSIREGSIIGAIIYAPIMGFVMRKARVRFGKILELDQVPQ